MIDYTLQARSDAMWRTAARQVDWALTRERMKLLNARKGPEPLPDVNEYAASMPNALIDLVLGAVYSEQHGCPSWWLTEPVAAQLRPLGLCEVRGRCLTAFGQALRRLLQ